MNNLALLHKLNRFLMLPLMLATAVGCSDSETASYPAEDIEVIIPYSPGGGFDTYVRALIPYIEKHLPNQVNVIPVNASGAGGRRGASITYRADPDGYTIGVFNLPGVLVPQLKGVGTHYDLFRITWLATLSKDAYALVVKKDSALESIQSIRELGRPIRYGATGPSSTSYIATTLVSEALEIPYNMVTGYKSSTEYLIGVIRGEIDAAFVNATTAEPYLESGEVKMLAIIGDESTVPGIPDATRLGIPELDNVGVTRMIGGPPGLTDSVSSILEGALLDALNDPGFEKWLEQTGNGAKAAGAEETATMVSNMTRFYEKFKKNL